MNETKDGRENLAITDSGGRVILVSPGSHREEAGEPDFQEAFLVGLAQTGLGSPQSPADIWLE
jgi:hypothetical protein